MSKEFRRHSAAADDKRRRHNILNGDILRAQEPLKTISLRPDRNPAIILVSGDNLDVLEQQFWRYTHEYDVRCASTAAQSKIEAADVLASGGQVALFVLESVLPDMEKATDTEYRSAVADVSQDSDPVEKLLEKLGAPAPGEV